MTVLVWSLPLWLLATAAATPFVVRWSGRNAGYLLGTAVAGAAVAVAASAPSILDEAMSVSVPWIPQLGAQLALRLDALSLLFSLLVLGIGALVLWYSPGYLDSGGSHGRYYTGLMAFVAAMTTLVLANDLVLLYVAWEATTIASVVLIAHRSEGRGPALKALVINVAGGFALLAAALVALAVVGDVPMHELGRPDRWPTGAAPFLGLLLVAAAVKSAQPPFHSWLPDAMVAPTPVSAYLHAAAMVKAGVYLLLRFGELLASEPFIATATVL
ncbi:MAG: proton-conducting transporter membrane subunit, partial [Nitriliruptorales bacterium]|nr:proton-conducting transporter membrane subunit [Nitriliruptorales bacterium]